MKPYIGFLRGINVGGHNRLPMTDLVALCEGFGYVDVETYIQSGNLVFRAAEAPTRALSHTIADGLREHHGIVCGVNVLARDRLREAMRANPFPQAEPEPKTLHLHFLECEPEAPNLDALERLRRGGERFRLLSDRLYLHVPDGIGRSRLAANLERVLGISMTGRNWRTIEQVMQIADRLDARTQ